HQCDDADGHPPGPERHPAQPSLRPHAESLDSITVLPCHGPVRHTCREVTLARLGCGYTCAMSEAR
ncbi:MAG: hypothetical protein ACRDUW_19640, partial [Pseudonocardiaceae bacterium]